MTLIVALSSFAPSAQATNYYADNGMGDIGFDGLTNIVVARTQGPSTQGPKRYVADAITVAPSGNQIVVAAGSYRPRLLLRMPARKA